MRSLRWVGIGLIVVLVDFRYAGVDLLVDVAGWAMVYAGLRKIWRLDNAFRVATGFAFVAGAASIPQLFPLAEGEPAIGGQLLLMVHLFAAGAVMVLTCTGVMRLADQAGNRPLTRQVLWLRSALAIAVLTSLLIGWDPSSFSGGGLGLLGFLVLGVSFVAVVLFVVLMFSQSVRESGTQSSQAIT
jgi:hypothetical protein